MDRAQRYERQKAREHRGKHQGGPGKPDYTRGKAIGEVKDRKTPVTAPELADMIDRGVTELDTKSGLTRPARELAKDTGVKVFSRGRRLV